MVETPCSSQTKATQNGVSHRQVKTDNHSSSDECDEDSSMPKAPNGGWGWAIVVASFIVHLIADGCSYTYGVIYSELLDYFGDSKAKTAWVGSLFISIPMLAGPIASAATNRYGCRATTMVGGCLAGLGFILSFFAPSIEVLCVTFGIISGFGLALVYVPAVVVVAYYFEDRRAFATGIAVAGSGIGTFLFAPLTEFLFEVYGGWRGAVLILGGIMLNIVVCGMIFRPLDEDDDDESESETETEKAGLKSRSSQSMEAFSRWSSYAGKINDIDDGTDKRDNVHMSSEAINTSDCAMCYLDPQIEHMLEEPVSQSLVLFPTYLEGEISVMSADVVKELKESGKTLREILTDHNLLKLLYERRTLDEVMTSVAESLNRSFENAQNETNGRAFTMSECEDPKAVEEFRENAFPGLNKKHKNSWPGRRMKTRNRSQRHHHLRIVHPLSRKDIFYRGNLQMVFNSKPPERAASCPDVIVHVPVVDEAKATKCGGLLEVSKEVKQIFREMLDISILRTATFIYFCASCMLLYSAYDVPYMYTPEKVLEHGFSNKLSSYILSIIGLASTIGQILVGFIGDLPQVNTMHFYNFCITISGLSTCFVPTMSMYWMFCLYGAIYGFFISANYALTTIIIVNLFGMSKLTNAYGIIMLAQGASNLVGPPFAGFLSDLTGSYDLAFYLAGVVMIVSGLMLFAIPCLKKYDPQTRPVSRADSHIISELQLINDAARRASSSDVDNSDSSPTAGKMLHDRKKSADLSTK